MNMNNNNRQSSASLKPEYVLKRVTDLINSAVGNNADKEKRLALELLHSVIGAKRKAATFNKIFESLMKRHIELCVDLKDHLTAKDGLHQYRNLCQVADPNSLESVIIHLLDLSEAKASAAKAKADKVALAAAARVSDLDQEESPESIMLSSMTEEGAKDRTNREVVVPWLKFLWENYRAILELIYKIPKLDKTYHKTCEKAFKFCLEYRRVMEFRRLCEILRSQLISLQKVVPVSAIRINRPQWEWTPELLEYHLQTRFAQLEVATQLELWNEGYRTVEDIYSIIVSGKKNPKSKLMMTYYEKLAKIFWVSENKLFHAYAWFRYHVLTVEGKKDLKAEDKAQNASCVLLSALTIPTFKDIYSYINLDDHDDTAVDRKSQMAVLFDFQVNPSRQSLLTDIVAKGVLSDVYPELVTLYESLEVKFQPLSLVKNVLAAVNVVKSTPALAPYAAPLQKIIVLKVMQQLAKVYSTVKLDFVYNLLSGLKDITVNQVEKILVEGVASKQLQLRVHHSTGCIYFQSPSSSSSTAADSQISQFGAAMTVVASRITKLTLSADQEEEGAISRREFFEKVLESTDAEYGNCQDRKMQIERRKETLEKSQIERANKEREDKEREESIRIQLEKERLENEEKQREEDRRRKQMELMELERVRRELEKYGRTVTTEEISALDSIARRQLIAEAQSEALKAKEEENRKQQEQAKRLDFITRALRLEEAKSAEIKYKLQSEKDAVEHAKKFEESESDRKAKHVVALVEKERLSRMQGLRSPFEESIIQLQNFAYNKKVEALKVAAHKERVQNAIDRARYLYEEELERIELEAQKEIERLAKEERDRLEREHHERLRREREIEEEKERERERLRQVAAEAERKRRAEEAAAAAAAEEENRRLLEEKKRLEASKPAVYQFKGPAASADRDRPRDKDRDPRDFRDRDKDDRGRERDVFPGRNAAAAATTNDGDNWRAAKSSTTPAKPAAAEPSTEKYRPNFGNRGGGSDKPEPSSDKYRPSFATRGDKPRDEAPSKEPDTGSSWRRGPSSGGGGGGGSNSKKW